MKSRQYKSIEELVEVIVDNRGKSVPTVEEGIPLIATNCIKSSSIFPTFDNVRFISEETYDSWFRAHLEPGDILFVNKGTPGRCCIVPEPVNFVAAQDMVGLRFKKEFDPFYMLAVIRGGEIQKYIENNHVGLVIPHLRKQELVKLKLPIQEKYTRDKIGEIYKNISLKIELNNKINAELESMAKLLYDYWFVQFDFPDKNGKPYKSSGGKMVYNEALKREIPAGWEYGTANDIFDFNPKLSISKGELASYIDMNALPENGFMTKKVKRKPFKGGVKFQNGDVAVARITPCLENGKTGLISLLNEDEVGFGSTEFIILRGKELDLRSFGCCLARSEKFRKFAISKMTGTSGRQRVNATALENYKMALPNYELLQKFESKVSSFFDKMTINVKENQKLAELRDWLLPMLMNGQVKVK